MHINFLAPILQYALTIKKFNIFTISKQPILVIA